MLTQQWIGVLLALLVLTVGATGPARADFIYSNFGPGQTYIPGYYSVSGGASHPDGPPVGYGAAIAEPFIPAGNFVFRSVKLPLGWISGTNAFTVALMSNDGGHPGSILESFSIMNVPLYTRPAIETFVSRTNTSLDVGTTYWVAAIPVVRDTAGGWFMNSTGAIGLTRTGNDGLTWTTFAIPSAAFEVDGLPVVLPVVPEPSSLALFGVGTAALAGWRLRRARSA
jgi:hypothetical protein